jgi:hypothetical protein
MSNLTFSFGKILDRHGLMDKTHTASYNERRSFGRRIIHYVTRNTQVFVIRLMETLKLHTMYFGGTLLL